MKILIFCLLIYPFCSVFATEKEPFCFWSGDLIFQEACPDKADDTIKEVTESAEGYNFTHVGMVYIDENDSVFVIEATIPKVKITPIQEYLFPDSENECYPLSVVGRLKQSYHFLIPTAIVEALRQVGKEYDYAFDLSNDAYYCSELVYDAFLRANDGIEVFPLNVMTFKSPQTGKFTQGWIEWFDKLGIPIPEGESGINPGAMSCSDVIEFLYRL